MAKKIKKFKDQQIIDKLNEFVEHHLVPIKDITDDVTIDIENERYRYEIFINSENQKDYKELVMETSELYSVLSSVYDVIEFEIRITDDFSTNIIIDYSDLADITLDEVIKGYLGDVQNTERKLIKIFKDNISFPDSEEIERPDWIYGIIGNEEFDTNCISFRFPLEDKYRTILSKIPKRLKVQILEGNHDIFVNISLEWTSKIITDAIKYMYDIYKTNNLI